MNALKIHGKNLSENIFCSPVQSFVPTIFRISYVWEKAPENVENKVARVAVFKVDFDHIDFDELSH